MVRSFALALVVALSVAGSAGAAEPAAPAPAAAPVPAPAADAAPSSAFAVTATEVVAERDVPQVCFTFSRRLDRTRGVDFGTFVQVVPWVATTAVVRDKALCVEGLAHGGKYTVTLGAGLPGRGGAVLDQPARSRIDVPHRAPSLAFRGAGYILPRVGAEGLPLRTINVERVRLQVRRITDRSLVEQVYFGRMGQTLSEWDIGELVEKSGQQVWRGEMAVNGARNAPVVTAFPVGAVIGRLEPGIYIAIAENVGRKSDHREGKATQWFVISDLGLTTFAGEDGLRVFARSLATAEPVAGVELRLLARNHDERGKVVTAADGIGRFEPGLMSRDGDAAPQAMFAYGAAGDFGFLDLSGPGFDLSDRGAGGRAAPGPADAFLFTDRGIYRPGDTVHMTALLRDAKGMAVSGAPLTLKVVRPDGFEVERRAVADAGIGSHAAAFELAGAAFPGRWTVTAHADPQAPAIGRVEFRVDDVVPPRLELGLATDRPVLGQDGAAVLTVTGRHLFGAPAVGLPGELSLTLRAAAEPFPGHDGYHFGLAQEDFRPQRTELPGFTTDDTGTAQVNIALGQRLDTTRPLEAVIRGTGFDFGGRPVSRDLVVPVRHQPFAIGVRPRFDGDAVPEGATVAFDVLAVAPDGAPIDQGDLSYELFEEDHDYVWFEANGRWDHETVVRDRRVTGGALKLVAAGPAAIEEPVGAGRYRLEVFHTQTGVATSVRFSAGWWVSPTAGDRPDKVDVSVMLPSYKGGDTAWVYVRPPYKSQVLVAVADRAVRKTFTQAIGPEGAFLEIPVDKDWTAGVYVIATAFAPADPEKRTLPRRAIGLAWLAMDPAPHTLDVKVAAPADAVPLSRVTVPVTVAGAEAGATARVTLAAVDDTVLQLTGHAGPDPVDYFLGKRRLAVELRDVYGRLIDPGAAERGRSLAAGGELPPLRQVASLPRRGSPVVALFSGVVTVGADGTVSVPLDLPDFTGRLRLMAVAWTGGKVGRADALMTVRDRVAAEVALPRFLAPGDSAQIAIGLDNLSGPPGDYVVRLTAGGGLKIADGEVPAFRLDVGQHWSVSRLLSAEAVGPGTVRLEVLGPEGFVLTRDGSIPVRPAEPPVIRRQTAALAPDKSVTVTPEPVAGLRPETVTMALSVGALSDLDLGGLLLTLERHPNGGAEPLASRVLPLLSLHDTAIRLGLGPDDKLRARVQKALDRLMTLQRADGAFAQWSPRGEAERWLTAYVLDVLTRARAAGYKVSESPYKQGLDGLKRMVDDAWLDEADLPVRAYAYYVLARAKAIEASAVHFFQETHGAKLQTDLARAQVVGALALLGDGKRAGEAFAKLGGARVVPAGLRDYGSELRDQAAVVAIMAEGGADRERLAAAGRQLGRKAQEATRLSTQEQAWLLVAARSLIDRGGEIKLQVGDQTLDGGKPLFRRLDPGGAALTVKNLGDEPVTRSLSVVGVPTEPPSAETQGFEIRRAIFDMAGRPIDPAGVSQYQLLVVILDGRSLEPQEHQARIVDRLPAGLEVENVRLADSGQLGDLSWLGELSPARHVDYRDDRFVAALDLDRKTSSFRVVYLARAVTPGDFEQPGAFVEDMYKPRLFARGATSRLRILPAE